MPFIHPERRLNSGGALNAYGDELPDLHLAGETARKLAVAEGVLPIWPSVVGAPNSSRSVESKTVFTAKAVIIAESKALRSRFAYNHTNIAVLAVKQLTFWQS